MRNNLLNKYKNLFPDFSQVPGLDLKDREMFKFELNKNNWGLVDCISRVRDENEFICFFIQQNKEFDQMPIVLYSQIWQKITTIASSVNKWFPCYFVYQVNELLKINWNPKGYNPVYAKYAKESLENILANKQAIIEILNTFNNTDFIQATGQIFKVIEVKDQPNHPDWDYVKLYRLADGKDSHIARYHEIIKETQANGGKPDHAAVWEFIQQNPQFNEILNHWAIRGKYNLDMAKDYYSRKVFIGSLTTDHDKPARMIKKAGHDPNYHFNGIVDIMNTSSGIDKPQNFANEYFKLGEMFEAKNDYQNAVNSFENVIYFMGQKPSGYEFHPAAFQKLVELANAENDTNYTAYLKFIADKLNVDLLDKKPYSEMFAGFLPDLSNINGLNLNYNHLLDGGDINIFPNLCVESLYSIGGTGHDHLVYCLLPDVEPENYPIAVFGEEEGVAKVISSSVKTWLLSYLIYKINQLLQHFWLCEKTNQMESAKYTIQNLNNILENKKEIEQFCGAFDNKPFLSIIDDIFEAIDTKNKAKWDYWELYRIAENQSPVAQFIELIQKNSSKSDFKKLILDYPDFNYPLYCQFHSKEDYLADFNPIVEKTENIDTDIALQVFSHRLTLDFKNTSDISKILVVAAKACYHKIDIESPYNQIINTIAEYTGKYNNLCFADHFFTLGEKLKQLGQCKFAAYAFENAIFLSTSESEEFHFKAFSLLLETAQQMDDKQYWEYLKKYSSKVNGADEENEE